MAEANSEIAWARGSTAMRRSKWSRPVALALEHGLVTPERSFLDYGCGHGDDFRSLRELGFDAAGWDPAHLPDGERRESAIWRRRHFGDEWRSTSGYTIAFELTPLAQT